MYKKSTSSFFATSLMLSLTTTYMPAATAVNAEWINGSGNYSVDTNWNIPAVPCNAGSTTFDVNIPASIGTVSMDVPPPDKCTVDTLTLGANSTFSVLSGNNYTIPGLADISGIVRSVGGNFLAPIATFTGNTARASASGGATVEIGAPIYSATGLSSTTLFSSTGTGSVLNLSTLQSIDSSFNDGTGAVRANSITASSDASLDLSGVTAITAPARGEDRLDINVSDTAVIDLSSLSTISGGGTTRFVVTAGGVQLLPALQTVSRGRFDVSGGAQLSTVGSNWTYINQLSSVPLFTVSGTGSVLNLSTLQSIDSSFNDGTGAVRANSITASSDASLDLSGVTAITAPARGEDRLDISVSDTAAIDLSSLATISGGGQALFNVSNTARLDLSSLANISSGGGARFNVSAGGVLLLPSLKTSTVGGAHINLSTGAELQLGDLSGVTAISSININDSDSRLFAVGSLLLNSSVSLISVADAVVSIAGDYSFKHTNETQIDLESTVVQFDGVSPQLVEVGGFDIGTFPPTGPNFGFGQMIVGTDTQATTVYLRDAVNNGNGHVLCGPGEEALYLLGLPADPANPGKIVSGLRILGGSTLVLNGIPLYTLQDGALVDVRTWFPPGQTIISYALNNSNGFIALGSSPDTDADNDSVIDANDNCVVVPNANQRDTNGDGYGSICDPDLNNDLIVQAADLALFKPLFFTTDPDADFDGNGRVQAGDLAIMKKFFFLPPGPSCVAP